MRKINLLYVITKLELGGAQKQLLSLIRHLDREKFNITLFTAQEGLLAKEASSIPGLTLKRSRWLERQINPVKDIFALIEIFIFIIKNRVDIVHTHSSKAGILGRLAAGLAKTRIIIHTVHGWSFNDYQLRGRRLFFIWLERVAAAFTDKFIVVSNYDRLKGLHNGIGTQDRYIIVRYGIDREEPATKASDAIRKELKITPEDLIVTMVSCLKPQKSPKDFLRLASLVVNKLSNVKFVLAGDGILRATVEDMIDRSSLRPNVILLGWRTDISRILSATDIFVLTSLWEGLPIALLEGMSCAKPVIATDTGGVAEIIKDG
ncbi:MAG: glycosyltransferase family 4 protein, partial [Deltaproteobacteria bacterium]